MENEFTIDYKGQTIKVNPEPDHTFTLTYPDGSTKLLAPTAGEDGDTYFIFTLENGKAFQETDVEDIEALELGELIKKESE